MRAIFLLPPSRVAAGMSSDLTGAGWHGQDASVPCKRAGSRSRARAVTLRWPPVSGWCRQTPSAAPPPPPAAQHRGCVRKSKFSCAADILCPGRDTNLHFRAMAASRDPPGFGPGAGPFFAGHGCPLGCHIFGPARGSDVTRGGPRAEPPALASRGTCPRYPGETGLQRLPQAGKDTASHFISTKAAGGAPKQRLFPDDHGSVPNV